VVFRDGEGFHRSVDGSTRRYEHHPSESDFGRLLQKRHAGGKIGGEIVERVLKAGFGYGGIGEIDHLTLRRENLSQSLSIPVITADIQAPFGKRAGASFRTPDNMHFPSCSYQQLNQMLSDKAGTTDDDCSSHQDLLIEKG